VHKWGCDLFIILGLLRILRIAFRRTYKAPGEIGWLSAIGLVSLAIAGGLSGYLLVWNQRAFEMGGIMAACRIHLPNLKNCTRSADSRCRMALEDNSGGQELSQAGLSMTFATHIASAIYTGLGTVLETWRVRNSRHMDFNLRVPPALLWTIAFGLSFIALILPHRLAV